MLGARVAPHPRGPVQRGDLPGAISDLEAAAQSTTTVLLTWTAAEDATSHKYRIDGGEWITTSSSTSHLITGLTPGTSYDLEVRGVNGVGDGPISNLDTATTPTTVTPPTVAANGDQKNTTTALTSTFLTLEDLAVNDFFTVFVSCDNSAGTGGTQPVTGITDTAGNTYTMIEDAIRGTGSVFSGSALSAWGSTISTPMAAGGTVTITYSPSMGPDCTVSWKTRPAPGYTLDVVDTGTAAGNSGTPSLTTAARQINDVVLAALAAETNAPVTAADTDTLDGVWSAEQTRVASTGTVGTSQRLTSQYKVVTGTSAQVYNPTLDAVDNAMVYVVLRQSPGRHPIESGTTGFFTEIFADDFNTDVALGDFPTSVAAQWTAYPSGWPDTRPGGSGTYRPEAVVSITDGILNKHLHHAGGEFKVAAITPRLPGGLGTESTHILYGRFSYSARFPNAAVGYKVAWLLWPQSNDWPDDGELDYPEHSSSARTITRAFHHNNNGTSGSDQVAFTKSGVDLSVWNVYTQEWSPNLWRVLFNGELVGQVTSRVPDSPMRLVLQSETRLNGVPPPTDAVWDIDIDWVTVSAYTPT